MIIRIADGSAMGVQDVGDLSIRSYAFVISVWNYHFPGVAASELTGVKNEETTIVDFLKGQGFDEAIILQNDEAKPDVIRKIFTEYFLKQFSSSSASGMKIRFMFIFDGHGWQPPSTEATGALALSDLQDEGDLNYDHRFSLAELRGLLQDLSPYAQSLIALLGSCYSGSVFTGKAFAEDVNPGPSAWIATSVPGWDEAWVLPEKKGGRGTVFFQDLISVIKTWSPPRGELAAGDTARGIDFGFLTPNLREIIDFINQQHRGAVNPDTGKRYPAFTADTVAFDGKRNGAYRFIVPTKDIEVGSFALTSVRMTGSSVIGHPDIAIVHTPEYYKINGVDLSYLNGDVDFGKLKAAGGGLRFAYLRATQSSNKKDPKFTQYFRDASGSGISVGAYHFFDFCAAAEPQFELIKSVVPNRKDLLPMAITLEWLVEAADEAGRFKQIKATDCNDVATIRTNLKKLLELVENYFHKRPIIYTASSFLRAYPILDESFNSYSLWLADYSKAARQTSNLMLPGKTLGRSGKC